VDRTFTSFSAFALFGVAAADLRQALIFVVCLVVATAFHEFAHAFAADRLGDPTPGRDGRLTLNPLVHADPIGTIALPLMAGLMHGPLFGWGRPVMTQPRFYTRGMSMRAGMALVSFAGPLANVIQALFTLGVLKVLVVAGVHSEGLFDVLKVFFQLNLVLAVFKLLPIHPLDGGKFLTWILPTRFSYIDDALAQYGWMILLALMLIPGPLQTIFTPIWLVSNWALRLVGV
jgi:Zn-dependent protease